MSIEVLTVSSKGQVVLPAAMRKELSITSGAKLAAYASGNTIVLKMLDIPTESDFLAMLDEAEAWAKGAGLAEGDIDDAIKSVRSRKRA